MNMATSCIPIFILFFLSSFCKSDDTLTHAKPLFSGDKLVASKGVFALGFFSQASCNTSLYLGIWHNQIPHRRFVWVANRDNPITTPSSAMLAITDSSELRLSGSQGITSWTTKINSTSGVAGAVAVQLDTGNFVLQFANGTYIWQSFDHPTDTILPTKKFLVSHKGQMGGRLVAWKGPNGPTSGDFSCSGAPASPDLQMLIRNGTRPYYRGVWNGRTVSGGMYLINSSSIVEKCIRCTQRQLHAQRIDRWHSVAISSGQTCYLEYRGPLASDMLYFRTKLPDCCSCDTCHN